MADLPVLTRAHEVQEAIGKAIGTPRVVLLYFTAKWCGPCKKIKPFVIQLQAQHVNKLATYSIDIDAAEDKLLHHFNIKSVPTFIFIRENQVVAVSNGADQQALSEKLDQVLS